MVLNGSVARPCALNSRSCGENLGYRGSSDMIKTAKFYLIRARRYWMFVLGFSILLLVLTACIRFSTSTFEVIEEGSAPVQAIVYLGLGAMAELTLVDNAVITLQKLGGWEGPVFVVTDRPNCFSNLVQSRDTQINLITVPEQPSIMHIKALKAKLFDYLPPDLNVVLYLDADILVARDLKPFLSSVHNSILQDTYFDYGMFLDAGSHLARFCSGCDKWHTGIIVMNRNAGNNSSRRCLNAWHSIMLSGKFDTDQESLDYVDLKQALCPRAFALPPKYLLFAKDYLGTLVSFSHIFIHLTGAGKLEQQDWFYRNVAIPYLRSSVRNSQEIFQASNRKSC